LRDLIAQLGDDFWRLRIGIGHPGDRDRVLEYVLGRPPATEAALIHETVLAAADAVPVMLADGAQKAMNRLHARGGAGPSAPEP
jgi:PTH1 family peptidyl-tRNA hydrolase